jgi:hypothetical protein
VGASGSLSAGAVSAALSNIEQLVEVSEFVLLGKDDL